ncbi:hypothetical protein HQ584_07890 [Patescibacteria group bacterium]|nr:hypothetical protein [Patescibacteria group bacterium]
MKQYIVFILLICLFLAGCVTGEANRLYLKERLPAKDISEVEVWWEAPTRPYIVIADFQASYATAKHMQKRAAEIGADAVILTLTGGWYSESEVWADSDRYSDTGTGIIGTAIKYKTE